MKLSVRRAVRVALLVAVAELAGCASSPPVAKFSHREADTVLRTADTADVTVSTASGVTMADYEKTRPGLLPAQAERRVDEQGLGPDDRRRCKARRHARQHSAPARPAAPETHSAHRSPQVLRCNAGQLSGGVKR